MNPETNAVVHCHPLNCVTLAVRNEPIRCNLTPEGAMLLGHVPMIAYYTPGSDDLVTQGRSLEEAYNRMEELEFQARLQLLVGDAQDLPADEVEKLSRM